MKKAILGIVATVAMLLGVVFSNPAYAGSGSTSIRNWYTTNSCINAYVYATAKATNYDVTKSGATWQRYHVAFPNGTMGYWRQAFYIDDYRYSNDGDSYYDFSDYWDKKTLRFVWTKNGQNTSCSFTL